tara:strand:- start:436 stop:2340 length:1905 start_codon:yes stop_codon:yes gene_type:complete
LSKNNLILLDRIADWKGDSGVVVSWGDTVVPSGALSLPVKTQEHAISLKAEFLKWAYELGKAEVNGRSLISYLKIFDNLSFWWLTSVAEKSPSPGGPIFQTLKLRTLENIYSDKDCQGLVYLGGCEPLHSVLKSWSLELGHSYKWIPCSSGRPMSSSCGLGRKLARKLPYILQGITWFVKQGFVRWRHVKPVQPSIEKQDQSARLTIVTFFPNIDMKQAEQGIFRSKYWQGFHDYLKAEKLPVDWVWFYFESKDPSFKEAVEFKNELNRKSDGCQRYFLLEEFLGCGGLWKSFGLYLKFYRKACGLNGLQKAFCFPDSKINFFPMMKDDWNHSLFGTGATQNIIWAVMFDSMAQKLPAFPCGLYTWENQTWERALVSAWKRYRPEGRVIGYQHSFIRLMDLRMFSEPEAYKGKGIEEFPLPDVLGINSSTGLKWMCESGYPSRKITRIEALRFFGLSGKYGCFKKPIVSSGRKLLVVTGMLPEEVRFQIQLLKQAGEEGGLGKYDEVWIKPHPALMLDPILNDLKPNFKFTIVTRPLIELMGQADVVCCSNSTGASLEAAWLGVPSIILAAMDSMNLNPLFGLPDQSFVKDCAEMLAALENPRLIEISQDYFFLDGEFRSWKNLLEVAEISELS